MDVETKIKEDMRALGCNCETNITLAYHLYIYLVDEKLMYDTEYCFNRDINTLYVVARPSKTEKMNIYVPVPTGFDISMDYINKLQTNLCTVETGATVNLAFVEGDFTVVLYAITKGLVERPLVEKLGEMRAREARRSFINSELNKSKQKIVNEALNGGFVEDDDCQVLDGRGDMC